MILTPEEQAQDVAIDCSPRARSCFGAYLGAPGAVRINLGLEPEPGFETANHLNFEAASVDVVLASHVLHKVNPLLDVIGKLRRALRPAGVLCIVSKYASSDDAWEDLDTVRAFTERSFALFPGFEVVSSVLIPFPDLNLQTGLIVGERSAEFEVKRRFMRNVVKEMRVVLRKVA